LTKELPIIVQKASESDKKDVLELTVGIDDKVSTILETFEAMGESVDFITHNGKLLKNPEDLTLAKLFADSSSKFVAIVGKGESKIVRWVRFPKMYLTDYYYMNTRYYDAVVFKPKMNIQFHGFGVFANYNNKDVIYTVQWSLNDDKSEEFQILKTDSE